MSVNSSRVNSLYDAEASVEMRAYGSGAVSSTTLETPVALNELNKAYWDGNEIPHGVFEVCVQVRTLNKSDGNETYVISLQIDDTPDHTDGAVKIAEYTIQKTGFYKFYVDSKTLPDLDPDNSGDDKWLAIKATLGGTTPSMDYSAWIGKSRGV